MMRALGVAVGSGICTCVILTALAEADRSRAFEPARVADGLARIIRQDAGGAASRTSRRARVPARCCTREAVTVKYTAQPSGHFTEASYLLTLRADGGGVRRVLRRLLGAARRHLAAEPALPLSVC